MRQECTQQINEMETSSMTKEESSNLNHPFLYLFEFPYLCDLS